MSWKWWFEPSKRRLSRNFSLPPNIPTDLHEQSKYILEHVLIPFLNYEIHTNKIYSCNDCGKTNKIKELKPTLNKTTCSAPLIVFPEGLRPNRPKYLYLYSISVFRHFSDMYFFFFCTFQINKHETRGWIYNICYNISHLTFLERNINKFW